MGLTSSLLIGQTALAASQLALQVTGNNLANATTPGYHRQRVEMLPISGQRYGNAFIGRGVQIDDVRRMLDPALQARLRNAISQEEAAGVERDILDQIESLTNELTGSDLSSQLGQFFNAFSELANNPASGVTRSTVIEQGASLASFVRSLRTDFASARDQIDRQLGTNVIQADGVVDQIAALNTAIVNSEVGSAENGSLRDQRDVLIDQLSSLFDVTTIEQSNGSVDVLIGSAPVVLGGVSRGLELRVREINGERTPEVVISSSQEALSIDGGRVGALLSQRGGVLQDAIDDLDTLSSQLIFEVNKAHTSGRPSGRLTSWTGELIVPTADRTLSLNDPTNATFSELPFNAKNGSFQVTVYDANGNKNTTTIQIDLDGITNSGAAGFGDDTSLDDIRAALDAIPNLNAEITPAGQLRVTTDQGFDVAFGDDTSGALAVLGINTFFSGTDATNIAVREEIRADPTKLVVGMQDGTNETALAIANLRTSAIAGLGGQTFAQKWSSTVERTAVQAATASTRGEALKGVRESLEAQAIAISGVSVDEESLNLIAFQQQYQGAARFIGVINELTQVLLNLV